MATGERARERAGRLAARVDRAMVWLLVLLVFLLPLVMWPTIEDYNRAKGLFAAVFISVLLCLWAVSALLRGEWRIRLPWLGAAAGALVVAALLSLLHATDGRVGLEGVGFVLLAFLLYLMVVQFVREKRDAQLVLFALLISASLASLYGLLQYLGVVRGAFGDAGLDEIVSTMGNRNYLGEFLASLLFPAVILVVRLRSWVLRAASVALIAFSFGTALLVRQASVLVALPVAFCFVLLGLAVFRPLEPIRRSRRWIVGLLLALGFAFLLEGPSGPLGSVVGLAGDTEGSWLARVWEANSGRVRAWNWRIGWEMLRDHPIVGAGLGNYGLAFLSYRAEVLPSSSSGDGPSSMSLATYAHNDYVQAAAELGGIGILAILGALALAAVSFWRRLRRSPDPADRLDLVLLGGGLVAFLVLASVGFPTHLPASSLVLLVTLGLATSRAYGDEATWSLSLRRGGLRAAVVCALAISLGVTAMAAREFSAEVLLVRGAQALRSGSFQAAETSLRMSVARSFAPSKGLYRLGSALASQGRYAEAVVEFEKCQTRYVTADTYVGLAGAALAGGDIAKAQDAIDYLLSTRPGAVFQVQAAYLLAMIDFRDGRPEAGRTRLEALASAMPDYEGVYLALGDYLRVLSRAALARANYEKAGTMIREKIAVLEAKLAPGRRRLDKEYHTERDQLAFLRGEERRVMRALGSLAP